MDFYVSGIDPLSSKLFKLFCDRNRITRAQAIKMFVDLMIERHNWALGTIYSATFNEMDKKIKQVFEENPALKEHATMSVVQRHFGYFIKPITKEDIIKAKKELDDHPEDTVA